MKDHKGFKENPPTSNKTVLEEVTSKFEPKPGEAMPELLSRFIKLLEEEKEEEWEGVNAMRECLKEFRTWKEKLQKPNDKVATCKDFEIFLFALDRNVIVLQGGASPITSKAGIQGPPANGETRKGTDNPSTNKPINPATNRKTLKVKIYMGTGWETDFPNLRRRGCSSSSSPDLYVNLTHGGKIEKTTVQKGWQPSWGEKFMFPLSNLENDELVVKVCDRNDKFAGTVRLLVSELEQGIHVIPLSFGLEKPCNTARLLMRFTFG